MSRSYYKHNAGPVAGPSNPGVARKDARLGHKRWRRATNAALDTLDLDYFLRPGPDGEEPHVTLPILREKDDVWGHASDGRQWYGPGRRRQ